MRRDLAIVVAALLGCGQLEPMDGDGTADGAAGTTGAGGAGTSGAGGTSGAAGRAGTSGAAGTSGSAGLGGTTGGAGSSGAAGAAGGIPLCSALGWTFADSVPCGPYDGADFRHIHKGGHNCFACYGAAAAQPADCLADSGRYRCDPGPNPVYTCGKLCVSSCGECR